MSSVRERVPWWAKLAAKLVLARLPLSHRSWRSFGIFRHGRMLDPQYAEAVFEGHFQNVRDVVRPGFTVLELGPGDSLATALLAAAEGAGRVWLVDSGADAETILESYAFLRARLSHRLPSDGVRSMDELLAVTNTTYLTSGLDALRSLPSDSADLIFSQAVLEHIPLRDFEGTIRELFRIQAPGGVSSHRIDLKDHLGASLNSLRFSRERWESPLFARSGFYTNRLRASEIVDTFTGVGFQVRRRVQDEWSALPLPRTRLHADFAGFADEDLRIRGLDLVLQKP